MNLDVYQVKEKNHGWDICLKLELEESDVDKLLIHKLRTLEDYEIFPKGNDVYFKVFMDLSEPWEDEPLEELLKAIIKELKYQINLLLK
jgi:hypothetical protein